MVCQVRSFDLVGTPLQYLLDEIADMTRQSPEAAQAIADAVQKKLGVKSPIVKFKVPYLGHVSIDMAD